MTNIQNESITIKNPFVKFALCKEAFDNYAGIYNKGKELRDQIRSPHYELFFKIVRFYITQLSQDRILFAGGKIIELDPSQPPVLRTNNKKLGRELKRNNSTIYRQLQRLIFAEVIIQKKHHGHEHDYELLINPQLLLITDSNNPDYKPNSEYLTKSKNSQKQPHSEESPISKNASCNHNQNKLETFNNLINPVNGIPNSRNDLKETKKNTGNTEACDTLKKQEESNEALKKYSAQLRAKDEKFSELKNKYAMWLFIVALKFIWRKSNIYEAEKQRTLQYISENYFEHCTNETSLFNAYTEFKWRIEAAGRYIERQEDFKMNLYPYKYFNLNNTNGFIGTKKWYRDYLFRQQVKVKKKQKLSDDMKLANMLRCYTKTPNYDTFRTCKAYIQDNIPHLLNQFCQSIIPFKAEC